MSSGSPQTGHKVDKQDIKGLRRTRHKPAKPVMKGQQSQDSTVENETFMRHIGQQG